MSKYYLLIIVLATLIITWAFALQSQGGRWLSQFEKLNVNDKSILKKLLLRRDNQDYSLKIYKVIPWAICLGLCCIVLLIYILYAVFYATPFGNVIGLILENRIVQMSSVVWSLIVFIYIGIINML